MEMITENALVTDEIRIDSEYPEVPDVVLVPSRRVTQQFRSGAVRERWYYSLMKRKGDQRTVVKPEDDRDDRMDGYTLSDRVSRYLDQNSKVAQVPGPTCRMAIGEKDGQRIVEVYIEKCTLPHGTKKD